MKKTAALLLWVTVFPMIFICVLPRVCYLCATCVLRGKI